MQRNNGASTSHAETGSIPPRDVLVRLWDIGDLHRGRIPLERAAGAHRDVAQQAELRQPRRDVEVGSSRRTAFASAHPLFEMSSALNAWDRLRRELGRELLHLWFRNDADA